MDILARISAALPGLNASERRVGEVVCGDPDLVVHGSVQRVARRAGVSDPTVLRFCRSLGFEGYTDLRLSLVRGAAAPPPPQPPRPGMAPAEAAAALLGLAEAALASLRRGLDATAWAEATALLRRAPRVELWPAPGAEAAAAALLPVLLARGPAALTPPMHWPAATAGLHSGDVVVALAAAPDAGLDEALAAAAGRGALTLGLGAAPARVELPLPATNGTPPPLLLHAQAAALAAVLKETP